MPRFTYTAKAKSNQTFQGEIEAETEQDAVNKLTKMGNFPISIKNNEVTLEKTNSLELGRTAKFNLVLFTRQLSSLIGAGVNIINSLNITAEQSPNKYMKTIIGQIIDSIERGKSLSESLSRYPRIFSNLYISLIHSGETGGKLEETFKNLADFLEKDEEFKSSIRASLTYPSFVLAVGLVTVLILLTFVIPRLISMFEDMQQVLPLPTRILIALSDFLCSYGWMFISMLAVFLFLFKRAITSSKGKLYWDSFKLKLLFAGDIILKTEISRFMRTFSLLLSGGVSVITSLEISSSIFQNTVLKAAVAKLIEQISGGSSLSSAIMNTKIFPDFVINIISVGEEIGSLDKSLLRIADYYEKEVDRKLKTLSRMIEPIIILVVGLLVGFIVLSMLLPIFQLNLTVK